MQSAHSQDSGAPRAMARAPQDALPFLHYGRGPTQSWSPAAVTGGLSMRASASQEAEGCCQSCLLMALAGEVHSKQASNCPLSLGPNPAQLQVPLICRLTSIQGALEAGHELGPSSTPAFPGLSYTSFPPHLKSVGLSQLLPAQASPGSARAWLAGLAVSPPVQFALVAARTPPVAPTCSPCLHSQVPEEPSSAGGPTAVLGGGSASSHPFLLCLTSLGIGCTINTTVWTQTLKRNACSGP